MIKIKLKTVRVVTASTMILVILVGAAGRLGYGTLSSFGVDPLSFICPLGFLQIALASRNLLPQLWLSVALVLLSIVIFGLFFCAWVCPVPLLRRIFKGKGRSESGKNHATIQRPIFQSSNPNGTLELSQKGAALKSYSRYAILGGVLSSSFLFRFPVFCAVCPIGLIFGTLFAFSRLFFAKQPSFELLLFPALLGLELFALKSWCRSICPLGALLSVIGRLNRFLRPIIKKDLCLVSRGIRCRACEIACPQGINLLNESADSSLKDCTKCLECYEKCPVKAIRIAPLK